MKKIGIPANLQIDGNLIIALALIGGAYFLYTKRLDLLNAVNPASSDNIVNQAVVNSVGQKNVNTAGDFIFGAITLINPFADETTRNHAKTVYGIRSVIDG